MTGVDPAHGGILPGPWQVPWSHPAQVREAAQAMACVSVSTAPRYTVGPRWHNDQTPFPSTPATAAPSSCCCWTPPHYEGILACLPRDPLPEAGPVWTGHVVGWAGTSGLFRVAPRTEQGRQGKGGPGILRR